MPEYRTYSLFPSEVLAKMSCSGQIALTSLCGAARESPAWLVELYRDRTIPLGPYVVKMCRIRSFRLNHELAKNCVPAKLSAATPSALEVRDLSGLVHDLGIPPGQ